MKIQVKQFIFFASCKFIYVVFAYSVYTKFSSLGDVYRYLGEGSSVTGGKGTYFVQLIGEFLYSTFCGIPILTSLPLIIISSSIMVYILGKVRRTSEDYIFCLLYIMPFFSMWSSLISKEFFTTNALIFFAISVFERYVCGRVDTLDPMKRLLFLLSDFFIITLVFLLKVSYFPLLLIFYFGSIFIYSKFSILKKYCLLLLLLFLFIWIVYLFSIEYSTFFLDFISNLPDHFSGGTTRNLDLENNPENLFIYLPYYVFISFLSSTFTEVVDNPIRAFVVIEGLVFLLSYLYFIALFINNVKNFSYSRKLFFLLCLFVSFMFMITHVFYGVMNGGSGMRYRTNFEFFIVLILYLSSRYSNRNI